MQFSIVKYNINEHYNDLLEFCHIAEQHGITNNASIKALSLKPETGLFLTYYKDSIVSMAATHDFGLYYPGAWRILTRTATLGHLRGIGVPRTAGMVCCAGLSAYTVPKQVDYAQQHGATMFLFTTNIEGEGGTKSSAKLSSHLMKMKDKDPRYDYYDTREIYSVKQHIWKLKFRDIIAVEGAV